MSVRVSTHSHPGPCLTVPLRTTLTTLRSAVVTGSHVWTPPLRQPRRRHRAADSPRGSTRSQRRTRRSGYVIGAYTSVLGREGRQTVDRKQRAALRVTTDVYVCPFRHQLCLCLTSPRAYGRVRGRTLHQEDCLHDIAHTLLFVSFGVFLTALVCHVSNEPHDTWLGGGYENDTKTRKRRSLRAYASRSDQTGLCCLYCLQDTMYFI